MKEKIISEFKESILVKQKFVEENIDTIVEVSHMIAEALMKGSKLLLFGNGGSWVSARCRSSRHGSDRGMEKGFFEK